MLRSRTLRVLALTVASALAVSCTSNVTPETPSSTARASEIVPPYSDGILPVGDGKYVVEGPYQGNMYICPNFAKSIKHAPITGGAGKRGPWFTPDGKGFKPAAKPHINGSRQLRGVFKSWVTTDRIRIISTNNLPESHPVGIFPVALDDPARAFDPNPNRIVESQSTYRLPAQPQIGTNPRCVGSQVGIMLRGAVLLSPVDSQGRDAVAWEVQDHCDGHPEITGQYHYHGPSPCLDGIETDQVIGYALDGFPITGNRTTSNEEIFSRDLDICHGSVDEYRDEDGRTVRGYRYALTRDYPYSVTCFRGVQLDRTAGDARPGGPPLPPAGPRVAKPRSNTSVPAHDADGHSH